MLVAADVLTARDAHVFQDGVVVRNDAGEPFNLLVIETTNRGITSGLMARELGLRALSEVAHKLKPHMARLV